MRNEGSSTLGWWRSLALACIVVMGLGTIVGSGGDGDPTPASAPLPKFVVTPSNDTIFVGDKGGDITNERGETIVTIPKDAHIGIGPMQVRVMVAPDGISVTRIPTNVDFLVFKKGKEMVVTMPTTAYTPSGCPAGASAALPECWELGSLALGYFGRAWGANLSRPNFAYRLTRNRLATLDANAELRLELGSQLTSSAKQSLPNLPAESLQGRVPVLFIHGFQVGEGVPIIGKKFGGGDETWASLPSRVGALVVPDSVTFFGGTNFVPFEFRWQTNASFITVAKDLADTIALIEGATGSKVHIVAHSFGGLVARAALQDISSATTGAAIGAARTMFKSLTTVGTPHSGILQAQGTLGQIQLPKGWAFPDPASIPECFQISCYQAGLDVALPDFVREDLKEGPQLEPPARGYLAARLREAMDIAPNNPVPDLPVLTLIGESFTTRCDSQSPSVCPRVLADGDGLISYKGQRFKHDPSTERPALLFESRTTSGLTVSERILGLEPHRDSLGTDLVSLLKDLSPYAGSLETGYWHIALFTQITAGTGMQEVAVPSGLRQECNSPCEHDTWVNLREFLLSQHGGRESSNFPNTTGSQAAAVFNVAFAPNPAVAGAPVTISVIGANLPADIVVNISGCAGVTAASGGTASLRQFTCTPTQPGVGLPGSVSTVAGSVLGVFLLQVAAVPTVSSVSFAPNPAVAGVSVTISVAGADLPADTRVSLGGCTNLVVVSGGTTSLRQFSCTPTQPGVGLTGNVTTSAGSVLGTFLLPVAPAPSPGNQAPNARFSVSSQTPSAGQSVVFNPYGSVDLDGTIVRWDWAFGDGQFHTNIGPTNLPVSHVYTAAGTFTASLTVTDDKGATGTISQAIVVSAKPAEGGTQMAMTSTPDAVRPGQLVQYAVTATNRSTATLDYTITAQVPNGTTVAASAISATTTFDAGCGTNVSVCAAGSTIRWGLSGTYPVRIAAGQSATVSFSALVDATNPPPNGTVIRSTATASASGTGATAAADVVIGP